MGKINMVKEIVEIFDELINKTTGDDINAFISLLEILEELEKRDISETYLETCFDTIVPQTLFAFYYLIKTKTLLSDFYRFKIKKDRILKLCSIINDDELSIKFKKLIYLKFQVPFKKRLNYILQLIFEIIKNVDGDICRRFLSKFVTFEKEKNETKAILRILGVEFYMDYISIYVRLAEGRRKFSINLLEYLDDLVKNEGIKAEIMCIFIELFKESLIKRPT